MDLQHPATLNPFKSIALSFQFVRRLFHLHSAPVVYLETEVGMLKVAHVSHMLQDMGFRV